MQIIQFRQRCMSCFAVEGFVRMFSYSGSEELINCTEYQVELMLRRWKDVTTCEYCSSRNIRFTEIEVDKRALFDFERLEKEYITPRKKMLLFSMVKNEQSSECNMTISKHGRRRFWEKNYDEIFFSNCSSLIDKAIEAELCGSKENGHFSICITGLLEKNSSSYQTKIQRVINTGYTKEEFYNHLNEKLA